MPDSMTTASIDFRRYRFQSGEQKKALIDGMLYTYQFDLSPSKIIATYRWLASENPGVSAPAVTETYSRQVLSGTFSYSNGGVKGRATNYSYFSAAKSEGDKTFSEHANSWKIRPEFQDYSYTTLDKIPNMGAHGIVDYRYSSNSAEVGVSNDRRSIAGRQDVDLAPDKWWEKPFSIPPTNATQSCSISLNKKVVNEGESLSATVKTSEIKAGTILYWELTGAGVSPSDFDATAKANPLRGEIKVNTLGQQIIAYKLKNDLSLNEGDETINIKFYSNASRASAYQIGNTVSAKVIDSSKSPRSHPTDIVPKWSSFTKTQFWDIQLSQNKKQVIGAGQQGFSAVSAAASTDKGLQQWTKYLGNNYYRATRAETSGSSDYLIGASAANSNNMAHGAGWLTIDGNSGKIKANAQITSSAGSIYGVVAGFKIADKFIDIFNIELGANQRIYKPCIRKNTALLEGINTPELLVHCAVINKSGDTIYVAGSEKGNRNSAAIYKAILGANQVTWSKIGDIKTPRFAGDDLSINAISIDASANTLIFCGDNHSYQKRRSTGFIGEINLSSGTSTITEIELAGQAGGGYSSDSITSFKLLDKRYLLAAGYESPTTQEVQARLYLLNRQTKTVKSRAIDLPDTQWDLVRDFEVDTDKNIIVAGAGLRGLGQMTTIFPDLQ